MEKKKPTRIKPTKTPERKLLAKIAYKVSSISELTKAETDICEMLLETGYLSFDEATCEYAITDLAKYLFN